MSECGAYGCVCLLGPAKAYCTSAIFCSLFFLLQDSEQKKKKIKPSCFFPFTLAFQKKLMKSFFSSFIPAVRRHGSRRDVCAVSRRAWKNGIDPALLNSRFSPVSGVYEDKILSPFPPFSTTPYWRSLPVPWGDPLPPPLAPLCLLPCSQQHTAHFCVSAHRSRPETRTRGRLPAWLVCFGWLVSS